MPRNLGSLAFALVLACLVAAPAVLAQSTGKLSGRVTDELGDPLPGANVRIEGTQLGAATDVDGNYFVIGIPVGEYDVTASFVGFGTQTVQGVQVSSGYTTEQNFELSSGEVLDAIEVVYERPIIQKDAIGVPKVITGEQIQNLPVRGVTSVAALQSGIVSNEGSGTLNVRGGRGEEVDYYVDGVRVTSGALAVNQQAIQEQEVLIGTIPARYGDAMSGVISITTKSGGSKFFGSFEAITSEVLDDFGYNVATLSLGGPIFPERASFFFSLSGQLLRDASPYGAETLRLSDGDFDAFQRNPQVFRVVNAAGEVSYVPIPTDIPSGTPLSEVVADPDRFDLDIPDGFVLDTDAGGTTQIISRSETVTRERYDFEEQLGKDDPRRELTFNGNVTLNPLSTISLRLGGVFELSDSQGYSFGRSLFARDRYYNSDNETYRGYLTFRQRLTDAAFYQVQAEYQNYQNWLFPDGWNRNIENALFYGDVEAPQNAVARNYYTLQPGTNALFQSGDNRFVGGGNQFFSGPGSVLTFYQKRDFEQFRFSGSATAQLGLHQVEFGAEFEQRTNRFFSLAAGELSRYFNDGDAENADSDDNGGLGYDSYDELPFDAFGNGAASRSIVYRYYGYTYNGLEETNRQNIDCFGGCDTDGDGEPDEFDYDVEPYKPIYYAGYVSDKIEYRDLVIQLGLRVDIFDNNTQVPFDLYTPFPIVRAGSGLLGDPDSDFYNPNVDTDGDGTLDGYQQPGGVGEDDAVYFDGSGNVVGYRDLDGNFFDADGQAIDFDIVVDDLAGNVRALPGEVLGKVDSDAFVDYEPRVTVMPRVGVSFPVTDRALFFASYNVTSQRPSEAAFTPFSSYNALGTDRLSNSNLSPETTTQYELGFRQRVGERASVTLSGFYRTQDNKIQVRTPLREPARAVRLLPQLRLHHDEGGGGGVRPPAYPEPRRQRELHPLLRAGHRLRRRQRERHRLARRVPPQLHLPDRLRPPSYGERLARLPPR